jgi:hypothetical protein
MARSSYPDELQEIIARGAGGLNPSLMNPRTRAVKQQ